MQAIARRLHLITNTISGYRNAIGHRTHGFISKEGSENIDRGIKFEQCGIKKETR